MRLVFAVLLAGGLVAGAVAPDDSAAVQDDQSRPNILLAIADDWSWPHAGAYGDPAVATPTFDRVARDGLRFEHAFVASPSCTPSRAAVLTGQWPWRLGAGANLYGPLPAGHPVYPDLLEASGYHVGFIGKGWGPGQLGDRDRNPAGPRYESFEQFLAARPPGAPFAFWFGSTDPHRPYDPGSGVRAGIDPDRIRVPAIFPDHPAVRADMADYYGEVQRFDQQVGAMLDQLEQRGQLDETLVLMTSDNGMPFPRAKTQLYDAGTRVPLAVRWPARVAARPPSPAFVSLTDLAPTILEAAGVPVPAVMTGRSLVGLMTGATPDAGQDATFFGRERHVPAQEAPDGGGYPMRAIRTAEYLYIRNFAPERWPAGTPDYSRAFFVPAWYADTDNGPTKAAMYEHRFVDAAHARLFGLAFDKRPGEELYDLTADPDQLANVAGDPSRAAVRRGLWDRLMRELQTTGDPRVLGQGEIFDFQPYTGGVVGPYWFD